MMRHDWDGCFSATDGPPLCSFGVTEAIAGVLGGIGLGATAATVGADALVGAGVGAAGSALTGGNPLTGALTGGLGGGLVGGFAGPLADATGLSTGTAGALIGGGINAAAGGLTGGARGALTGALTGGLSGYAMGSGMGNSLGGISGSGAGSIDVLGNQVVNGAAGNGAVDALGNPTSIGTSSAGVNDNWGGAAGAAGSASPGNWNAPLASDEAGIASGRGSGGGLFGGKGISNSSLLLGALSAASKMLGGAPAQGNYILPSVGTPSIAQNLGSYYNTPLNTSVPGRTALAPGLISGVLPASPGPVQPVGTQASYYRYGTLPEQRFFGGNTLNNFGFARGGALREFSTGSDEHHVEGPGTGVSDSIPAKLSNGEYVLTADDLSRIGSPRDPHARGANEAGAKKLDHFRAWLAKESGQKQFPPKSAHFAMNEPRGALSRLAGARR